MKKISISLNPTYLCNFRCDFCYLTSEQLGDSNKLDLSLLKGMFEEVQAEGYVIEHVDLYGGEIALLKDSYLKAIDNLLLDFGDPTLNVITNLSIVNPYFLEEHVDLSVSFDFDAREKSEKVLANILSLDKEVSILMLASRELISKDVSEMINTLSSVKNIKSVEIKPYSTNQANTHNVKDEEFEFFVSKWLRSSTPKKFEFINESLIQKAQKKESNAFSDDHIYITPQGKFAVLEFDENDNEFFMELDNFKSYLSWCEIEKNRVKSNIICSKCNYLGHCLTEHYRDVKNLENSCNGYINLIQNSVGLN